MPRNMSPFWPTGLSILSFIITWKLSSIPLRTKELLKRSKREIQHHGDHNLGERQFYPSCFRLVSRFFKEHFFFRLGSLFITLATKLHRSQHLRRRSTDFCFENVSKTKHSSQFFNRKTKHWNERYSFQSPCRSRQ